MKKELKSVHHEIKYKSLDSLRSKHYIRSEWMKLVSNNIDREVCEQTWQQVNHQIDREINRSIAHDIEKYLRKCLNEKRT